MQQNKIKKYLLLLFLINLFLFHSSLAYAQTSNDYTQGGTNPVSSQIERYLCAPTKTGGGTWFKPGGVTGNEGINNAAKNDLYICINTLYKFAIAISSSAGVLMIVIAGYLYMSSDGNQESVDKAKSIITSTITAMVILFAGYVLLRALNPDLIAFRNVQPPSVKLESLPAPTGVISEGAGGGSKNLIGTAGSCNGCVDISSKLSTNGTLVAGKNTFLQANLASKLEALKAINQSWRVNEAYPPTVDHSSSCHFNGSCVDLGMNSPSAQTLNKLCKDAKIVGLSNILTEYTSYKASDIPECPAPKTYNTTTGGHLHISL